MEPSSTERHRQRPHGSCDQPLRGRRRARSLRRFAAAAFCTTLLLPAGAAGEPNSGSIVIGDPGQSASQAQSTTQNNDQGTSGGSVTIGNDQQATTDQTINQEQTGTFIVLGEGALQQNASQNADTVQNNSQHLGGLVLGNAVQDNVQHAATTQDINQVMNGTFIVLGGTITPDARIVAGVRTLEGCAICADRMSGSGTNLASGDVRQSGGSSQAMDGTFIVFGDLSQNASQNASTVENNEQSRSGSIILGDTDQKNNQQAVTNQEIDQTLTGTYIVFGTLDQSAGQNAETIQNNAQGQG